MGQKILSFEMADTGIHIVAEGNIAVLFRPILLNQKAGQRHHHQNGACDQSGKNGHLYMKLPKHHILLFAFFVVYHVYL